MISIQDILNLIEENYNFVELRDCCDDTPVTTIILNKKHSIEDFQEAIRKAKEKHQDEIYQYGNDWEFIEEELGNFDYMTYGFNDCDYWVEY